MEMLEEVQIKMSWIIRLQNLPLSANAADVRWFFAGLQIPDGAVHILGGPKGDVFIGFATFEDARQAMLRNNQPIHGQHVQLSVSSEQEKTAIIAEIFAGAISGESTSLSPPSAAQLDHSYNSVVREHTTISPQPSGKPLVF
ncbi:unnamed protein product [Toxocara canis]|uniref:RRM domain-containing protein n=1 Tax=Toxocara canis TaxID=6265 RepID=A0A183VFF0_TOXCA|nr:unnamed protein product [Toxocara canis]